MELDRYLPRSSPAHRADARLKVLLALAVVLSTTLLPTGAFTAYAVVWLVLMAVSSWARLGPLRPTRGSWAVLPFVIVALPLLFTRPGGPVLSTQLGPLSLTVTDQGLSDALSIAAKSWLSIQVALLLAYTTRFSELIEALRGLRVPGLVVETVSFMYRYLAVMGDEAARLNRARQSRSASVEGRSGGSLRWRAEVTGSMVGSLFIRSYERSERIYAAMLARGFEGTLVRLEQARPSRRSLAWFALALGAMATFVIGVTLGWPR
jgi:cobalt/nickel transport system permease protein